MIKKEWLKIEESALISLLLSEKSLDWKKISKSLEKNNIHKSDQQCYTKYYNMRKKKNSYNLNFPIPEKKFSVAQEKKLLKLAYAYAPQWKKISEHFIDKTRFDVSNHFYGIIRKALGKACRLIGKKKTSEIFWKIKPKLYSTFIKKEIEIDFKVFKESHRGGDEKCSDFCFVHFYEFVRKMYFGDFEEIWEKINEKEIFIVKKVIVFIIKSNFQYNSVVDMSGKKLTEFFKNEDNFMTYKNDIETSFRESFYDKNISLIELPEDQVKREREKKISEKKRKLYLENLENFKTQSSENEINSNDIYVLRKPLLFFKSKKIKKFKTKILDEERKKKEHNFLNFEDEKNNCTIKKSNFEFFRQMLPKIKNKRKFCIDKNHKHFHFTKKSKFNILDKYLYHK